VKPLAEQAEDQVAALKLDPALPRIVGFSNEPERRS
jgi:hypothetical protein